MAVTYVASATSTSSTSSTSLAASPPSGVTTDDMIVLFAHSDASVDDPGFSAPAGFTLVGRGGDSISDAHAAMWWKVWDSGDTTYTVTQSAANDFVVATIALRGCDNTNPINSFAANTGSGSSCVFPASELSSSRDGCMWVGSMSFDGGDTTSLPSVSISGATALFTSRARTATGATNLTWCKTGYSEATAGASNQVTITWGGSPSDGHGRIAAFFQPPSTGPAFNADGVTGANISTISGVPAASVSARDGASA